jgi:hypothetical protein
VVKENRSENRKYVQRTFVNHNDHASKYAPLIVLDTLVRTGRTLRGGGDAASVNFRFEAEADMASAKLAGLGPQTMVQRLVVRLRLEAVLRLAAIIAGWAASRSAINSACLKP